MKRKWNTCKVWRFWPSDKLLARSCGHWGLLSVHPDAQGTGVASAAQSKWSHRIPWWVTIQDSPRIVLGMLKFWNLGILKSWTPGFQDSPRRVLGILKSCNFENPGISRFPKKSPGHLGILTSRDSRCFSKSWILNPGIQKEQNRKQLQV